MTKTVTMYLLVLNYIVKTDRQTQKGVRCSKRRSENNIEDELRKIF